MGRGARIQSLLVSVLLVYFSHFLSSRDFSGLTPHEGKADISIKLVKMFQNSGDCVAFDEKECVIHESAIEDN